MYIQEVPMSLLNKSGESKNVPVKHRFSDTDIFKSFDDFFSRRFSDFEGGAAFSPMVNIDETKDAYHVEAELPGVKKEDIDVSIKDDYLVIKGEKKSFNEEKKDQYHRVERSHGSFYRTIALPGDIDQENISAELKDGLLSIEIKKSDKVEKNEKKISIH